MKTKFELHEEVYCVYCGEFYKADILSINIDSVSETYEVQLINYSSSSCLVNTKILECKKDEIFRTIKELITAIRSEHEEYISKAYTEFKKRYISKKINLLLTF